MRAPSTIVFLIGLSVGGCSGGCSGPSDDHPAPATAATQRTEASGSESTEREAMPEAAADPGPAPVLRIVGAVGRYDREVAIQLENHGSEAAELRARLTLQRREGDRWVDASTRIDLRYSCDDQAPECVTLAPGAVYIPPPWLGTEGDAQCVCTRCAPAPAGTYRFVATTCRGTHTAEGEPFELGS